MPDLDPLTPELLAEFTISLQQLARLSEIVDKRWGKLDTTLAMAMQQIKADRDAVVSALDATGKIIFRLDEIVTQVSAVLAKMTPPTAENPDV